ncbi:endonuclease/exonuclease/phosphatase family protein [Streptomyces sp. 7-21]|uniref:endonuclease/exonuclease/phosphatase family protein n=1 Tax=Streptomyces sp. 7-21 TaxID=2802283 RepID=UPI00191FC2A4|nr:endonuclease/exonuclease/phosphatase family protein [Streptomyces sp. 7-21]MBL1067476.1 endonuclease/exonuclease/phosphatase family protein [Streptomyces sp. 7-21]
MTPMTLPVAVITLVAFELLRVTGVVMDLSAFGVTVTLAGLAAAALTGPLMWWLGPRRALPAAMGALAAGRLLVQFPWARVMPVAVLAAAVAFAALLLAARRRDEPGAVARAVALAAGADVALRLPLDLWDPVWRGGVLGWGVALVLAAALAGLAVRAARAPAPAPVRVGDVRLALLGPALALYTALLASPGFVASQGGVTVTAAGLWIAAGTILGVRLLSDPLPPAVPPVALAAAVFVFLFLPQPGLPLAPLAALVGVAVLPSVLARALTGALATGRGPLADLALAGGAAGLAYGLMVVPDHLHYAPEAFPLAGALLLAVAAWRSRAAVVRRPFAPLLAACLLLAAPPLLNAARPAPDPLPVDTAGGVYRMMTWNIHHAVSADGELSPEDVLATIRGSGAHVVLLQEVPRGWLAAGGLDLVTWLERRLDAQAVFAPAEDRQSGNLILTSLPVTASQTGRLPEGEGATDRSYASVTVRLTDGETARITTAHLEGDDRGTRARQLAEVVRTVGDDPHGVLAGDLNARPGSPELNAALEAGLHSAQDEAGDPEQPTQREPRRRVDWILGGENVAFASFELSDVPASHVSDHAPLAVTVWLD